jgi:hypothetical protein
MTTIRAEPCYPPFNGIDLELGLSIFCPKSFVMGCLLIFMILANLVRFVFFMVPGIELLTITY